MKFNPFLEKAKKLESHIMSLKDLAPKPYDKDEVDPYTRVRCILMNGTEYEAVWSKHHFHRHCADNDVRRVVSLVRRLEQQQQKLISALKPSTSKMPLTLHFWRTLTTSIAMQTF